MKENQTANRNISFRRLTYEALPEMWSFQILSALLLAIPVAVITKLISSVAETTGTAVTTANFQTLLFSWRAPVILLLGVLLVGCYIILELFAQIHLCHDILSGRQVGIREEVKKGFQSLLRFFTPTGILILLYIFAAVPLCGIGFSITLTETLSIPNFIMDVIEKTPQYTVIYIGLVLLLMWLGYRSVFTLHAVLIDGATPTEARKISVRILKENGKRFLWGILKLFLILMFIQLATYFLFFVLPGIWLEYLGASLPKGHIINPAVPAEIDYVVVGYRILCTLLILMGTYINSVVLLLCGSYLMFRFTRYYLDFTQQSPNGWAERPKKSRYRWKLIGMIGLFAIISVASVIVGFFYNQFFTQNRELKIIAHRAGGVLASENSLEGLYAARDHQCYGSEIDIQRTKDGHYIVHHDNTFSRLAGVAKTSQELTLAEIKQLPIPDTRENGQSTTIATIEEMLAVIKGKEKLFIELKGVTADKQMVDDIVRIVKEMNCVKDVALISLNYNVIDYAETQYPDFETGTLFFAGIGDVSKLHCDLLIMEEEIATDARIEQVHNAGKEAIVWTVNTSVSMYRFLDSEADGIITDEIALVEDVQKELAERTDFKLLQDKLGRFWH